MLQTGCSECFPAVAAVDRAGNPAAGLAGIEILEANLQVPDLRLGLQTPMTPQAFDVKARVRLGLRLEAEGVRPGHAIPGVHQKILLSSRQRTNWSAAYSATTPR